MKQSISYLLIVLLFMAACNSSKTDNISALVKEIQQENIADKRLEYFNVEIVSKEGKSVLSGATVSQKVFAELKTLAEEKSLDFKVELLPDQKFIENQWAIVTLSVCNIRGAGRHSAELLTQAVMGTPVKVYKEDDGWFLIQTPDRYFGWVDAAGIALKTNDEIADWKKLKKVLYKQQSGFAYSDTNKASEIEFDLVLADLLSVSEEKNGFYRILLPDGRIGFVPKDECIDLSIWRSKSMIAEDVLNTAHKFKGVPYLWGGTSAKMVDCSGFVKSSYYYHGIILQRDASQQTLYGEIIDTDNGYEVLQQGDLVFFGSKATENKKERVTHVGMCVGNQEFIHASGKVRINSLDRRSEKYTESYEKAFIRARRVVNNVDSDGIEWVVDNEFYKEILP